MEVKLKDCPTGLFYYGDTLCVMTEYSTSTQSGTNRDAFIIPSGEYFWGGASTSTERSNLLVRPVDEEGILRRAIDRMGWPEIHAFHAELRRGQDIHEDAGGFMLRAIKRLFGIKSEIPVTTYQEAARAMFKDADNDHR